jgi:hypothetical protein
MKFLIYFLECLFVASMNGCAYALPPSVPVKPQGETVIAATISKQNIQVNIKTHEVQIGKPSEGRPLVNQSGCTYSKYPCSLVDHIDIAVDGNALYVPRSVFCDLADLNKAEVKSGDQGPLLILYGGDASESYIVKIVFDADNVHSKIISSAMLPDQPLQETKYYVQVLGD